MVANDIFLLIVFQIFHINHAYFLSGTNACSDCSCGEAECDHHAIDDGPNQVNFLATTNEVIEAEARHPDQEAASSSEKKDDEACFDELSRVIGALECTIADRKKTTKGDVVDGPLQIQNEMVRI